jgi:hypothetical protein
MRCPNWSKTLNEKVLKNIKINEDLMKVKSVPMTYYSSYFVIKKYLPKELILVG